MAGMGAVPTVLGEDLEQCRDLGGAGVSPVPAVTVAPVLLPTKREFPPTELKLRVLIAPDSLEGPGITPCQGWESILVGTEVGVKSLPLRAGRSWKHSWEGSGEQRAGRGCLTGSHRVPDVREAKQNIPGPGCPRGCGALGCPDGQVCCRCGKGAGV